MKAGKEHRVPLCDRALEHPVQPVPRENGNHFVFWRCQRQAAQQHGHAGTAREMRPGLTVHGFRSSFRDWAAERTNHAREVAEVALAHTLKDKAEAPTSAAISSTNGVGSWLNGSGTARRSRLRVRAPLSLR